MLDLKDTWHQLTSSYSNDEGLIENYWKELEQAYTYKSRHYHNLDHIEYMMERAIQYQDHLEETDTLLFSIFYHDIVYDIKRGDNEEKSALVAQDRLKTLGFPEDQITHCYQQIVATKAHQPDEDPDTNYLLDFDLAVLGETSERYQKYTQRIRKEYSLYPNFLYKKGRKKVLRHFLDMPFIFKTGPFRNSVEEQAKANLRAELESL